MEAVPGWPTAEATDGGRLAFGEASGSISWIGDPTRPIGDACGCPETDGADAGRLPFCKDAPVGGRLPFKPFRAEKLWLWTRSCCDALWLL